MKTSRHSFSATGALVCGAALVLAATPALAIDWTTVPGKELVLFYPGQASWEWVLTQSDHSGAQKFREGKLCTDCHEGEQADIGALIVSGEKVEPHPVSGKRGSFPVTVKAAHDAGRLYLRLEWTPQHLGPPPDMDAEHEVKVTVMIDDGSVVEMSRAGCWGVCHADANSMAFDDPGTDITKYLARSRTKLTRQGGGLNIKPDSDLAALAGQGMFLEYWQAGLNPGHPTEAVAGHILAAREQSAASSVAAEADTASETWVVTLSRPLAATGAFEKAIVPGKTYTLGVAIHEAHAAERFHHVSFAWTLRLDGGEADLIAVSR